MTFSRLRVFDAAATRSALTFPRLIDVLDQAFARSDATVPPRSSFHVRPERDGGPVNSLVIMPAWTTSYTGLKIVSVVPENAARGLPSVIGTYFLMEGESGAPLALIDGTSLTHRRTAAASALAARYLARADASVLLVAGAGALAPHLIEAHLATRPIRTVLIWNRTAERARKLAATLVFPGVEIRALARLADGVEAADIISTATMSREPLIEGARLKPGVHLDLIGGYTPEMREADDRAVARARLFADSVEAVLNEAGDILSPMIRRVIGRDHLLGSLADLATGRLRGRLDDDDITMYKSVGTALADLAAAREVFTAAAT